MIENIIVVHNILFFQNYILHLLKDKNHIYFLFLLK